MLRISNDLKSWAVAAGEAWLCEVQLLDANSQPIDIDDAGLVLSFYSGSTRAIIDQQIGERASDSTGEYFRWLWDGSFSESLYGVGGVKVELAQRYRHGRVVLGAGDLSVTATAATVPSLDGATLGDFVTRVTVRAAAMAGAPPAISLSVRPWTEPAPLPPYTIRHGDVVALVL